MKHIPTVTSLHGAVFHFRWEVTRQHTFTTGEQILVSFLYFYGFTCSFMGSRGLGSCMLRHFDIAVSYSGG